MRLQSLAPLFTLVSLVLVGCGQSGPQKVIPTSAVPVTGIVTLDGKPLASAKITFVPTDNSQGSGAAGATDSAGKYELRALFGNKSVVGAPPGNYKVVVSLMVKPDGSPMPADSQEPPMMSGARESLPLKYSDFASTQLSASVASSGSTFNFDLKSGE